MTQIKTVGNSVEVSDSEFFVTTNLIDDRVVIFPIDQNSENTQLDVGYSLSYQYGIELAVNLLAQILGNENPQALGALMARIKADALLHKEQ
jgi:hypothetical protein